MVDVAPADLTAELEEFIRFCYERRRVGWPELYDDMCAVAGRGTFHGLGYPDLADRGITFTLMELPRIAALAQHVVRQERSRGARGAA